MDLTQILSKSAVLSTFIYKYAKIFMKNAGGAKMWCTPKKIFHVMVIAYSYYPSLAQLKIKPSVVQKASKTNEISLDYLRLFLFSGSTQQLFP